MSQVDQSAQPIDSPPTWGLVEIFVGLFCGLAAGFIAVSLYVDIANVDVEKDEKSLGLIMASFAGLWLGWLGAVFYAVKRKGSGSFVKDLGLKFQKEDIWIGAFVAVLAQFTTWVMYLPLHFWWPETAKKVSEAAESMGDVTSGWGLLPLGLAICVGAPLVEEIFFRGLVFRGCSHLWNSKVAVACSGILFGAIHFQLLQTPALIAFGIILAVSVVKTGRLGPAIIGHCVFNSISFAFVVLG